MRLRDYRIVFLPLSLVLGAFQGKGLNWMNKARSISLSMFCICLVLFIGSAYRMETCGYDCGLFSVSVGIATVVYYAASFWLGIFSFAIFIGINIYRFIKLKSKTNSI